MKKKGIVISIAIGTVILVLIFIFVVGRLLTSTPKKSSDALVTSITLQSENGTFSLDGSGNAVWTSKNGEVRSELWSGEKTASFFAYYYANWATDANVFSGSATVNSKDELAQVVLGQGGGGGGGGGGGDIGHYFDNSTPTPTPTPVPNDGSGGEPGGDGGGPSWCIHWRLSYCADPPASSPLPTETPTPGGPTPIPPDCNDSGNQVTGRTVIGNELCLPSPSPTAAP